MRSESHAVEADKARAHQLLEAATWLRMNGRAHDAYTLLNQARKLDPTNSAVEEMLGASLPTVIIAEEPGTSVSQSTDEDAPLDIDIDAPSPSLFRELQHLLRDSRIALAVTVGLSAVIVSVAALSRQPHKVEQFPPVGSPRFVGGQVWSFPPGATVRVNGSQPGQIAPFTLEVPWGAALALEVSMPGYRTQLASLGVDGIASVFLIPEAPSSEPPANDSPVGAMGAATSVRRKSSTRDAVMDPYGQSL